MKLTHTIPLGVLDLEPISRLTLPALAEIEDLKFNVDGTLIDPTSRGDATTPATRMLVNGTHMRAGAIYAFTTITPAYTYEDIVHEDSAITTFVTLNSVKESHYKISTHTESDGGKVEVTMRAVAQPYPVCTLSGDIDMTRASQWLASSFYGGTTKFDGFFDLPVAAGTGNIAGGTCKGRGFRGRLEVELVDVGNGRNLDISVRITGRRLMRPLVFLASPFVRYFFKKVLAEESSSDEPERWQRPLRKDLSQLDRATRTSLDARNFVRRCVVEESFLDENFFPQSFLALEERSTT